jgi:hypothetical protein
LSVFLSQICLHFLFPKINSRWIDLLRLRMREVLLYCTMQQGKAREKMLKYQEELERQYRAEEDRLMEIFLKEREEELSRIDKEAKDEWEVNLRALLEKYEKMGIKPDALPLTGARGPRNSRGGSTGDEVDDRGRNVR